MPQADLTTLRREIATIEGRSPAFAENGALADDGPSLGFSGEADNGRVALGVEPLDAKLGGGLPLGALHEFRCEETRGTGALTGFAAGILARIIAAKRRPVLWIEEEMALSEAGLPFGPGFARFGLDPANLLVVRARRTEEALWAFEEGLRCTGLAAVLAVIRGAPRALDLTASRRLALRAASVGVTGLLLRQSSAAEPGAAVTRWRVASLPAGTMDGFVEGVGRPAFRAVLEKSRLGPTGSFDLEWHHDRGSFAPAAATHFVTRPAVPADRPAHAPPPREVVAFRKTG
jgi:protein ImuA